MKGARCFQGRWYGLSGVLGWLRGSSYNTTIISPGCGVPAIQPVLAGLSRIVNGEDAIPGSWPWQVSLQVRGRFWNMSACTGVLPRWEPLTFLSSSGQHWLPFLRGLPHQRRLGGHCCPLRSQVSPRLRWGSVSSFIWGWSRDQTHSSLSPLCVSMPRTSDVVVAGEFDQRSDDENVQVLKIAKVHRLLDG